MLDWLIDWFDWIDIQLQKQNSHLKRRSQQLLEKMQLVDIDIDQAPQDDAMSDSSSDEDNTKALNKKILCNYFSWSEMICVFSLLCIVVCLPSPLFLTIHGGSIHNWKR